jgi:hypothetical protein
MENYTENCIITISWNIQYITITESKTKVIKNITSQQKYCLNYTISVTTTELFMQPNRINAKEIKLT